MWPAHPPATCNASAGGKLPGVEVAAETLIQSRPAVAANT